VRWSISLALAATCWAGPKDFGLAELNRALAALGVQLSFKAEVTTDPPETFRIEPYPSGNGARIDGGDLRGLMYGLIAASEQIRATGKFARAQGDPGIAIRGLRLTATAADLENNPEEWFRGYFQMLALDRFNRFTLARDQAPLEPEFRKLRALSKLANDYGLDFVIGVPPGAPGLKALLDACPMIRGVQLAGDSASLDPIFETLRTSGRLITLDLRGALRTPASIQAAERAGVQLRLPTPIEAPLPDNAAGVRQVLAARGSAGYEIEAPSAVDLDLLQPLLSLWGRLGYDLKSKPIQ
jgi:hypothetical protein